MPIQYEVISVSTTVWRNIEASYKISGGPGFSTHNRVMYHFKVPLTSSKVSPFSSLVLVLQHVEEYITVTLFL